MGSCGPLDRGSSKIGNGRSTSERFGLSSTLDVKEETCDVGQVDDKISEMIGG